MTHIIPDSKTWQFFKDEFSLEKPKNCYFLDRDPQYGCNRQTDISVYVPRQRLGTVSHKVIWDDSYGTYPSVWL